jgi:hypothetical protein
MLSWKAFGGGDTHPARHERRSPCGDYYVKFEHALQVETAPILEGLINGQPVIHLDHATLDKAMLLHEKLGDPQLPEEKKIEIKEELKEISRNATPIMNEVVKCY